MAGEYPGHPDQHVARERLGAYLRCGVDVFVDLTTPADRLTPYEPLLRDEAGKLGRRVEYLRFPSPDVDVPSSPELMDRILDAIDHALASGKSVYVHCWGGVGRTGTVVGCYLVRHGATGASALDTLARLWSGVEKCHRKPHCPETAPQRRFVADWKASR